MGRTAEAALQGTAHHDDSALLLGMCHAFGSEPDVEGLLRASERWIAAALLGEVVALRFIVVDHLGRLRSVDESGEDIWGDPTFRRARHAVETKAARLGEARAFGGARIRTIPLVSRGTALGAVEIATTSSERPERWGTVDAVISQTAVALANLTSRSSIDRSRASMRRAIELGARIVGEESRDGAIRVLVRGLHRDLGVRSVGWIIERGRSPRLVSTGGLGSRRRDRLRAPALSDDDDVVEQLVAALRSELGDRRVDVTGAGGAVVLVETPADPAAAEAVASLRDLASEWFDWMSSFEGAERRVDWYGTALAVTAHEIRGPMLAAKATIDGMLEEGGHAPADRAKLRRSRRQLEELAETVDVLLRWSRPEEAIRRRGADLSRVVGAAVESVARETGERRVRFEPSPIQIKVPISRRHVSLAVANLVRNALAFSPPGSPVEVGVTVDGPWAKIIVRDRGPGIADGDLDAIFQPFVQGRSARSGRAGSGLGLFVVRRVAEAHGGQVWVTRGRSETTFHLALPRRVGGVEAEEARSPSTR